MIKSADMSPTVKAINNCLYLKVGRDWYYYDTNSLPLGGGAMGTVYVGRSEFHPGVKVAIKQIAYSIENIPSIRARARLEGNLKFSHHNLVEMIGCCEYDSSHNQGPIWLISKLVNGINLDIHVENNLRKLKNSVDRIVETMYPVLDALTFLHSHGIVHLDIKPSNIMVEDGHNIRLMDLGISSVGIVDGHQTLGLLGTPQFAAPEQFVSSFEHTEINQTTDIYQVGVTLYALLANCNPFDAPTIQQCMKLHKTLTLPSHEGIPPEIIDVLRKATAPQQDQRFQTPEDFKIALKYAVQKAKNKRDYVLIAVVAALIVFLVIVLILFLWKK